MNFTKEDISQYLLEVFESVRNGRCQISPREKNYNMFWDYVFSEQDAKNIILSLTPEDFSYAESNDHTHHRDEMIYVFGKNTKLLPRFGGREEKVALYIKLNKQKNKYVYVISLHKQEYPLRYMFK